MTIEIVKYFQSAGMFDVNEYRSNRLTFFLWTLASHRCVDGCSCTG